MQGFARRACRLISHVCSCHCRGPRCAGGSRSGVRNLDHLDRLWVRDRRRSRSTKKR